MRHTTFLVFILFSISASAQDCTKEMLAQKPGTWKAGQQGSINNVSAADLSKEKLILGNIHKLVSSNYSPKGCQILYSKSYSKYPSPGQIWIADPYFYSMYILRYLCDPSSGDKSKYYTDYSTPTTVNIAANIISSLNTLYAANTASDDSRGYLKLDQRPQKKDGVWLMGEVIVAGQAGTPSEIKEYRWLITYNDTLPFSYLNRREYLLTQKKRLEKTMIESPGDKVYLEKYMKTINDYLKKAESYLNQTAVCMWNDDERFEGFVDEGTKGSFIAVKPNMDYYHKKLPKSSAQFFTVVYKISYGDRVFDENIANIKKAVDFTALRNMLGK